MSSIGQTFAFLLSTASDTVKDYFPNDPDALHYPLIGALIQILIGALSDRSTNPKGRRRWTIILGFCIYFVFQLAVIIIMAFGVEMYGDD